MTISLNFTSSTCEIILLSFPHIHSLVSVFSLLIPAILLFLTRDQHLSLSFATTSSLLFGEGNGTPLQYSCLENPMDGGAWQVAVHGVMKSRTQLSDFTFTFHFHALEKEMATHSSVLAWRIPGMGEAGGCRLWGHTESDTTEVTQQQQQHLYSQSICLKWADLRSKQVTQDWPARTLNVLSHSYQSFIGG